LPSRTFIYILLSTLTTQSHYSEQFAACVYKQQTRIVILSIEGHSRTVMAVQCNRPYHVLVLCSKYLTAFSHYIQLNVTKSIV